MITAATIGHFDGVHLGHQHVIRRLRQLADERGIATITVVTFDRLPRSLFDPTYKPRMLMTLEERCQTLRDYGVDRVEVLTFDRQMASTPAYDFMKTKLRDELGVRLLLLGYDNRFGKRVEGEGFEDYVRYGKELGIEVIECDVFRLEDGSTVSSTRIRELIEQGNIEVAKQLLKKPLPPPSPSGREPLAPKF